MSKPKIKHTITKKEWNKKHKDFKLMGKDGIPYIMMYNDKIGTHLVPVKIIDESVNEFNSSINKRRAGAELKQKLKGKRSDGMGKYTATIYGLDSNGKRVELKSLNDLNKYSKFEIDESVNEGTKYKVGQTTPVGKIIGTSVYGKGRKQEWFYDVKKPGYSPVPYSEKSLDKLMGESIEEGMLSAIDQIRQDSKDIRDFVKNVFSDSDFKDMRNDKDFIKYLKSIYEGINEMGINDPIMIKLRAAQMKRNKDAAKKIEKQKKINPEYKALKNAPKIKALKKKRAEVMRDMEQEAEPEGGKIADRYGKLLNRIDNDIIKLGGNPMSESVNEAYIVLHSPKKGVKPVATAAYRDKKDAEKWAKDLGGITMIVKKKMRGVDESVNESKEEVTPQQLSKIQSDIRKINSKIKVYISKHPITKGELSIELGAGHDDDSEIQKIYKVLKKHTGDWRTGTMFNESVNESNDVYHKSYTHAIEAAEVYAKKKGYEIEDDEMFTKVGMNSKRPSVGKTTRVSLELLKNGKPQRKMLHIQVYGMKNGYELNAYIN